jgi:hypothetical protein
MHGGYVTSRIAVVTVRYKYAGVSCSFVRSLPPFPARANAKLLPLAGTAAQAA